MLEIVPVHQANTLRLCSINTIMLELSVLTFLVGKDPLLHNVDIQRLGICLISRIADTYFDIKILKLVLCISCQIKYTICDTY